MKPPYPSEIQKLEKGIIRWDKPLVKKERGRAKQKYENYVAVECGDCGKERLMNIHDIRPYRVPSGLCAKCRARLHYSQLNNKRGTGARTYKGGKRIGGQGYVQVALFPGDEFYETMYTHAIASRGYGYVRYALEHRIVMARHLGRPLQTWEHVHHIDGNKQNNSIENLELVDNKTHAAITALERENKRLKTELDHLRAILLELQPDLELPTQTKTPRHHPQKLQA